MIFNIIIEKDPLEHYQRLQTFCHENVKKSSGSLYDIPLRRKFLCDKKTMAKISHLWYYSVLEKSNEVHHLLIAAD